jgi:hypothetical protein
LRVHPFLEVGEAVFFLGAANGRRVEVDLHAIGNPVVLLYRAFMELPRPRNLVIRHPSGRPTVKPHVDIARAKYFDRGVVTASQSASLVAVIVASPTLSDAVTALREYPEHL